MFRNKTYVALIYFYTVIIARCLKFDKNHRVNNRID